MKKSYKFGEMLLYVREEYNECKYILDELKKCVQVSKNKDFYFEGNSLKKNYKIELIVEREYAKILKLIQKLKYDWYSLFLYRSSFNVVGSEVDGYSLSQSSILTPVPDNKLFKPSVVILDQEKFDSFIDKFLSLDINKVEKDTFYLNGDFINLNFGSALISSKLGYKSLLGWDGRNDVIDYSIKKECSPYLIERILYLEIPSVYIPSEWLEIFEKYENRFNDEIFFDVDIYMSKRKGYLQVDTSSNRNIKLLKK